jgi:ABC-type transport system involved in multi-copper enzyme maturation permease subunit
MDDMQHRQDTMQKDVMLVATAGMSLMNGMTWSPILFPFVVLLKALLAGTILSSPLVLTYLASLMASATTLVLAGVPAALYERAKGLKESSPASVGIWLAGTLALVGLPHLLIR